MKPKINNSINNSRANFDLNVDKVITMVDIAKMKEIDKIIKLHIQFNDGSSSEQFEVPWQDISKTDWRKFDEKCVYNSEFQTAKVKRFLEENVSDQLSEAHHETEYQVDQCGLYKIDNIPIYCAGQCTILSTSARNLYKIVLTDKTQCLDIDERLTETDALEKMIGLICLSADVGRIIISYKLVQFMHQAYIVAGIRPGVCLYLYGKTGTNKTTYLCLLTQTYNRGTDIKSPTRLNGSIAAAVNILSEVRDDVVIFDDLCPADSKQIRSKQEETLIEITRYIGDGTVPAKMNGKNVSKGSPKCGVIFTGEYLIGKGSDAARMLPVEMEKPDSESLKYFQDNPLIVSTFYKYFLEWYVENYNDIVALLRGWLTDYRKVNFGVHPRLQETHFLLNTSYRLLMNYFYDVDYITEDETEPLIGDFLYLLNELINKQNLRVQENVFEQPTVSDYLHYIKKMYINGSLPYARDVKNFNQKLHAGVLYKDCLCIRGEWLSKTFSVNAAEIAKDLYAKSALLSGKDTYAKQISKLKGKRFYFIPLDKLK